YVLVKTLSV
ncbi:DEAD/DEAH box helicase family protein, partial [Vibrio harveyi]